MRKSNSPTRPAARNPQSPIPYPQSRAGFTLVELLVVISIIAILAGLLLAAAGGALGAGKRARVVAEINQFNAALEDHKNTVGSYPPNAQTDDTNVAGAEPTSTPLEEATIVAEFERHLKRVAPNHREPADVIRALCGLSNNTNPAGGGAMNLLGGMNAAESLVFWLGGFSDDPNYPISGPNGPSYSIQGISLLDQPKADPIEERNWKLDIKFENLAPRDDDKYFNVADGRFITYADPRTPGQQRRINFWYLKAPGSPLPYAYFDASRGSAATAANDPRGATPPSSGDYADNALNSLRDVCAIKRPNPNAALATTTPWLFANDGKFQVLHGGVDERWGVLPILDPSDTTQLIDSKALRLGLPTSPLPLAFPEGPWTLELADTLTNFTDGTLEDAQP